MLRTSILAVCFGCFLFVVGCGTRNTQGMCSAAMLIGFGAAGVIEMEGTHDTVSR